MHAEAGDLGRQPPQDLGDLVLGVDLVELRGAAAEVQLNAAAASAAARADALQALKPIQLLLDQGRDPLLDHLRASPGIGAPDADPARGNAGQVLHLQAAQAEGPHQQQEQAQHQAEHGPSQEQI